MPARAPPILHRLYEALQARNYPTVFSLLSPEILITHSPGLSWLGPFQCVANERLLGAGDQMAVTVWMAGSTRRTEWRLAVPIAYFWVFKDGLAVHLDVALDLQTFQPAPAHAA
jgi:hypothetical protein